MQALNHTSPGEKWIRLLRSYAPVAENLGQQAELIGDISDRLGVPMIAFEHPERTRVFETFPVHTGNFRNLVLTGTAGDGKTSLCLELIRELKKSDPDPGTNGVETAVVETGSGPKTVTVVFDVTGWRKKTNGHLGSDQVDLLYRMALSSYSESNDFFLLAVNDGQLHELFRYLPADIPEELKRMRTDLVALHSKGEADCGERLRLINLSEIPSARSMQLCLEAVLDRPEWVCFKDEPDNPLFAPTSSIHRNFHALNQPHVRKRLITLCRIADACEIHLSIRSVLVLLTNALLGHPESKGRVLKPNAASKSILKEVPQAGSALHRTLFGDNLLGTKRVRREAYRFLSMLRVGEETTNDLDELMIFGRKENDSSNYRDIIEPDPFHQRDPELVVKIDAYIRGDLDEQETNGFLHAVKCERRRLLLCATDRDVEKLHLWRTTVFHHTAHYFEKVVDPLLNGQNVCLPVIEQLSCGLNRVWSGLLLSRYPHEFYITSGLDVTTSPVSDILLAHSDITGDEFSAVRIVLPSSKKPPQLLISINGKSTSFTLSLPRFEFLCRVAEGAMPSSFSKECFADFMALKQICLKDLDAKPSPHRVNLISVERNETIQKVPINLIGP